MAPFDELHTSSY